MRPYSIGGTGVYVARRWPGNKPTKKVETRCFNIASKQNAIKWCQERGSDWSFYLFLLSLTDDKQKAMAQYRAPSIPDKQLKLLNHESK